MAAWYQATWFYLLIALLALSGLLAAERARTAFLRHRQRVLEAVVEERTASLHKTQGELQILLDNAEQGFLAIGPDLLVHGQFSAACRAILGVDPREKPLPDLLYPDDARLAASQRSVLGSVFKGGDDFTRGLKLELMAKEARIGERIVQMVHKWLPERQLVMLMLSDVTETRALTAAVERERIRIEMIVLAITESREFIELTEEYRRFIADELPAMLTDPAVRTDMMRRLHTYKGLLAQFNFFHSPAALHQAEQEVIAGGAADPTALLRALDKDLTSVTDSLGSDFLAGGGAIALRPEQLAEMKALAAEALAASPGAPTLRRLAGILDDFAALDVKAALTLHSRGAQALAERLDKALAPVKVTGEAVRLPEERFSAFFRSLVHVFRNAVDHGIETPEERADADKPEEGEILCRVERDGGDVVVVIADDGQGIDRARLEEKWVKAGHDPEQAAKLPLEDLVFADGISSRDESSDLSGRGVGMAAVMAELVKVGGSVSLATELGQGTSLTFRLPVVKVDSVRIKAV
jgi:two-component system chemotaxis sensor kinase CheA